MLHVQAGHITYTSMYQGDDCKVHWVKSMCYLFDECDWTIGAIDWPVISLNIQLKENMWD